MTCHAVLVHGVTDLSDRGDGLRIGSVADISEADLEVFAVEAAGRSLVGELVPVDPDDLRMTEGGLYVADIGLSSFCLGLSLYLAAVEHSAVQGSEMELPDHYRQVDSLGEDHRISRESVAVVADDVAVLSPDPD